MKRSRAIALVVSLGLIATAVFFALRPREPVYQGRPLKFWLRAMEFRPGWGESVQSAQAREVVVNMGSSHAETIMAACRSLASFGAKAESAVPSLLGLTQHEDSNVRSAALSALRQIDPDAATKASVP